MEKGRKDYEYVCADVEIQLNKIINNDIGVIILDPPRSGLDKNSLNLINKIKPKQILYLSCDPITLARDLNTLKENYDINLINAYDMFLNTYHVETLVILSKKNTKK